uniref:NADH dehydrogenase subunit 6 n=1 Tax=Aglaiogyrodactylus forficulatus TaxID=1853073 RepID=A0A173G4T7_9PLAT|nr:NADH dehydrogenase subunit 6 [Aglaiogyrodactylus forficulatus]ANH20409.1 NADH dehydrogenase subunit 6 [Aglaiogyrodactylus forficulatus]
MLELLGILGCFFLSLCGLPNNPFFYNLYLCFFCLICGAIIYFNTSNFWFFFLICLVYIGGVYILFLYIARYSSIINYSWSKSVKGFLILINSYIFFTLVSNSYSMNSANATSYYHGTLENIIYWGGESFYLFFCVFIISSFWVVGAMVIQKNKLIR